MFVPVPHLLEALQGGGIIGIHAQPSTPDLQKLEDCQTGDISAYERRRLEPPSFHTVAASSAPGSSASLTLLEPNGEGAANGQDPSELLHVLIVHSDASIA